VRYGAPPIQPLRANPDRLKPGSPELTSKYPGRFVLGLVAGHPAVQATGRTYIRPLAKLASYLNELDAAEHPVDVSERVIAALRPNAPTAAATRAAGRPPLQRATRPHHESPRPARPLGAVDPRAEGLLRHGPPVTAVISIESWTSCSASVWAKDSKSYVVRKRPRHRATPSK
jgi:hypothetical protein